MNLDSMHESFLMSCEFRVLNQPEVLSYPCLFFLFSVSAKSGRKYVKSSLHLVNFKADGFDFFRRHTSPFLTECYISKK